MRWLAGAVLARPDVRRAAADVARAARRAEDRAELTTRRELAAELWAAAETPAVAYLVGRRAWPPAAIAAAHRLPPPPVRWLAGAVLARPDVRRAVGRPPRAAAGAVIYGYSPPAGGDVAAVQLDALTAASERTSPRWRRGLGSREGVAVGRGDRIAVAEGEVSAIALALRPDVGHALAVGGASGMARLAAALPACAARRRGVLIAPDADDRDRRARRAGAGLTAALALVRELTRQGIDARLLQPDPAGGGRDAADALAARIDALTAEHGGDQDAAWTAALAA